MFAILAAIASKHHEPTGAPIPLLLHTTDTHIVRSPVQCSMTESVLYCTLSFIQTDRHKIDWQGNKQNLFRLCYDSSGDVDQILNGAAGQFDMTASWIIMTNLTATQDSVSAKITFTLTAGYHEVKVKRQIPAQSLVMICLQNTGSRMRMSQCIATSYFH